MSAAVIGRWGRALAIGLTLLATTANAQTKRALGVDDFLGLKVASDIQLSPSGQQVAFTVSVASLAENRTVSRLWLHDLTTGSTRELTRGEGSDFSPRWAPDGRTLGFISTRNGSPEVWRIRTDGGEPIRMTRVASGVSQFFWSPDTTAVYVVTDVKWPPEQEIDRREGSHETNAKIWTELFYRHWNEWRVGLRQHLFRVSLADGSAQDLLPLDRDIPTLALGGTDVAVSPLGTELAVAFNDDSTVATSTNNDVFLVGPDGAGLVRMTENRGNDHSPAYSPNARWIAYLSMATPGFEADRQAVVVYDRATGERQELTAGWDVSVSGFIWARDSRAIVAEVEERGAHNLYRITVPEGQRTPLVRGGYNTAPQLSRSGDTLLFLRQTAVAPPELYLTRLDETNRPPTKLTSLNDATLAEIDLRPLEPFGFVGAAGDSVHGWLMKPPGFDQSQKYPVAYLIHGGPQGAWTDNWHQRWNYALFASRGYVVAAVNFHGSTGYGQAFTNSISGHWGDLPVEDLMKGLDVVAALPYVDPARVGAAGASYGGYMIYWLAGQTDRLKALVAHDGIFNTASMAGTTEELWFTRHEFGGALASEAGRKLLDTWSPANHVDRWRAPILIVHGQQDFRVDVSEGLQAFTAAKERGVEAKFLYFPDEGHFVLKPRNRRLWWGVVLDWLDEHLKPAAP
ncbi:MAG: S9 family peptidase [Gemmatimonadales bacterium]